MRRRRGWDRRWLGGGGDATETRPRLDHLDDGLRTGGQAEQIDTAVRLAHRPNIGSAHLNRAKRDRLCNGIGLRECDSELGNPEERPGLATLNHLERVEAHAAGRHRASQPAIAVPRDADLEGQRDCALGHDGGDRLRPVGPDGGERESVDADARRRRERRQANRVGVDGQRRGSPRARPGGDLGPNSELAGRIVG